MPRLTLKDFHAIPEVCARLDDAGTAIASTRLAATPYLLRTINEAKMLLATMWNRGEVVINRERAKHGLPPLGEEPSDEDERNQAKADLAKAEFEAR